LKRIIVVLLGLAALLTSAVPARAGSRATAAPSTLAAVTSVGHCVLDYTPVNNSHGRLELDVCLENFTSDVRAYSRWTCYQSGNEALQPCNIGADHMRLWFNATLRRDNSVSAVGIPIGIADWKVVGDSYPCSSATIHSDVTGHVRVRFVDGTLWYGPGAAVYGSQSETGC
jgi:hypothetical protein